MTVVFSKYFKGKLMIKKSAINDLVSQVDSQIHTLSDEELEKLEMIVWSELNDRDINRAYLDFDVNVDLEEDDE